MRIIAGSHKGRKLVDWETSGIRPMRDFVRSALFNILIEIVPEAAFLDLFSGTGSVGLEAISRGARSCTFVDASREACAIVRRNLDAFGLLDLGEVIEADAVETIGELARRGRRYDVVFIGPPYYRRLVPAALDALADGRLLGEDPVVVTEIHHTEAWESRHGVLELVDRRRYGDNRLLFYRPSDEADEGSGERRTTWANE